MTGMDEIAVSEWLLSGWRAYGLNDQGWAEGTPP